MQFDHLHLTALAAIIRERSFDRAAAALHVTPSAISQRIRALEERTGAILVVRENPCRATAEGEKLYRHALQIELLESDILQSMKMDSPISPKPLAVAVNSDSLSTWFPDAIRHFAQGTDRYLDIAADDQDYTAQRLRNGRVLGAVTTQAKPIQGCKVHRLGTMRYCAVASPDFVRRYFAKGVNSETLAKAPCLLWSQKDSLPDQLIRAITGTAPATRPPYHCFPSFTMFIEGAAAGLGWAPIPDFTARDPIKKKQLLDIAPGIHVPVQLYWQCWRLSSPTLTALTQSVQQAAKRHLS